MRRLLPADGPDRVQAVDIQAVLDDFLANRKMLALASYSTVNLRASLSSGKNQYIPASHKVSTPPRLKSPLNPRQKGRKRAGHVVTNPPGDYSKQALCRSMAHAND